MIKAVFVRGGTATAQLPYAKAIQSGPPRSLHSQPARVRYSARRLPKGRRRGGRRRRDRRRRGSSAVSRCLRARCDQTAQHMRDRAMFRWNGFELSFAHLSRSSRRTKKPAAGRACAARGPDRRQPFQHVLQLGSIARERNHECCARLPPDGGKDVQQTPRDAAIEDCVAYTCRA